MTKTLDDATAHILDAVLQTTTLGQALYRDDDLPLGVDVYGDEHENPNQPYRKRQYVPATDAERARDVELRRKFMRESWGLTDAEIDEIEARP